MVSKNDIIGVSINNTNISRFVNEIIVNNDSLKNTCISATGAHGIINATNDERFYNIINSFDYNLPDGQPTVWLARIKGAKNINRCFGPYVFAEVMKATYQLDIKHFFCGGKEGVAEKLIESCKYKFKNYNIVGTFCPPFREMSEDEVKILAEDINSKRTDIVWIGISTPKQEILAKRLSRYTNIKFIFTVGAAFDYYTGSIIIAPFWVQKAGLEWLYRLILEPKRLWKRYFEIVPKFLFFGILDILGLYKHPFKRK